MKLDNSRKFISFALCLCSFLGTLFFSGCGQSKKASSVIPVTGQSLLYKVTAAEETSITLERSKILADLPLPPEYDLVDGDVLENSGTKPASIKDISEGHKFVLSPKAKIQLGIQKITLFRGKSLYEFKKINGEFKIHLPNAVLGIRGTRFMVEIQPDGKSMIKMFEGKIEITRNGQITPLQDQQMAVIDSESSNDGQSGVNVIPVDQQKPGFLDEFKNNDGSAIQTF